MMLRHRPAEFITHPGFSVGVLLTTPPFPYTRKQVAEPTGLPILFEGALDEEDHRNLHFGEIGLADGAPVTSGLYGWTMVVTGCGPTLQGAGMLPMPAPVPSNQSEQRSGGTGECHKLWISVYADD